MKNLFLVLILLATGGATESRNPFETALARVGLTKQTARIDRDDMNFYGGDRFRLHFFDVFMDDPYKIPDYTPVFAKSAVGVSNSIGYSVMFTGLRIGAGVRRGLITNPVTDYEKLLTGPDWIANAVKYLYKKMGEKTVPELKAVLPESLAMPIALIVVTAAEVVDWQKLAFESVGDKEKLYNGLINYIVGLDADTTNFATVRQTESAIDKIDYDYLSTGATDLGLVLDSAVARIKRFKPAGAVNFRPEGRVFDCPTPMGDIIVNGTEENVYPDTLVPFLIVDLGGNDTYHTGAANLSPANSISIVIDCAGNDKYISTAKNRPSFGGAVLGYSFLIDLGGNDVYDSKNITQGAGVFGVGLLYDEGGDDTLKSYTAAQGAGLFGLGICINRQGNDYYMTYQQGQGYGYVKGCGLLADNEGNDVYVANDSDIVFPSAQSKEHNSSLAQGMGFGKRADFTDGHSLAGGVGILADGAGNDSYSCGVFGQGCAYWYGVGILADLGGNDSYNGIWYVQGSGAHFGVGILYEAAGDDHYKATINMAQGAGHDFTVGFLLDCAGNDTYDAPNLSLGGGNANGIGIFWDKQGDDVYNVSAATTLGRANIEGARGGIRDHMICMGLFMDTGGKDKYSKPFARNNKIWTQKGTNEKEPIPMEKGVGLDW
jgi:hypothetical protein